MPQVIPIASLSRDELRAALESESLANDAARLAAGLARGAKRRTYQAYASAHLRNAIALADELHGAPDPEILALSADDLLAELFAP